MSQLSKTESMIAAVAEVVIDPAQRHGDQAAKLWLAIVGGVLLTGYILQSIMLAAIFYG